MELSIYKFLAALSMSLVTFLFTMFPVILVNRLGIEGSRPRNFRIVSFLSCFGGGVFMATCLLHLFPDVQDQIVLIFKTLNLDPKYPVAEFLLCVGFLIVLIVEQVVLSCQEYGNPDAISIVTHQHSHAEPHYQNYESINENTEEYGNHDGISIVTQQHTHGEPHYQNYGSINNTEQPNYNTTLSENQPQTSLIQHEDTPNEVSFHQDHSSHSILRSLLLLFALSLHSIFEGLAIGLQSSVENVIRILLAVLIHKCIIAFTLGLNLTSSRLKRGNIIIGNIFFSLTSPVGIIIGLVVVDFVSGLPMMVTSGILQGIAAGTFLYVTFFEILPHELNSKEDRLIKIGCLLFGFSVVSGLILLLPD